MGLYDEFALLPPPPRSALSSYPEGVRATLPDFTLEAHPAEALRKWTRSLYYLDLEDLWVHLYIGTAILALLTVVIWCFIILPQIVRGSFWLFRLVRKPGGTLIVPNAMIGFTGSAGVFAGLIMAWFALLRKWHATQRASPTTMYLLLQLVWVPLIIAAYIAALGLFHARPNAFSSSVTTQLTGFQRYLFRPVVLNTLAVCLPILQITSVLIPALIAHFKYVKNLHAYEVWRVKYASQAELSQDMVLEAQRLWYGLLDVYFCVSQTFATWTAWALAAFFFYTFLFVRLMYVLHQQLKLLTRKQFRRDNPTIALETFRFKIPADAVEVAGAAEEQEENCGSGEPAEFFPRVNKNSHIVRRQAPRSTANSNAQYRYLKTAFFHVSVQGLAISPAILMYTIIACWLAIGLRSAVEDPNQDSWCRVLTIILSIASYTACCAGSIVLFSIAHRTAWEPLLHFRGFIVGESSSDGAHKRPRTRNGPSRPSTAGRGGTLSVAGGDSGRGQAFTTYFESETLVQRPSPSAASVDRPSHRLPTQTARHEGPSLASRDTAVNPLRLNRRASQTIIITEVSAEAERNSSCDTFLYDTARTNTATLQPMAQPGFTQHPLNGSTSDISDGKHSTTSTVDAMSTTSSNPPTSSLRAFSR